MLPKGHFLVPPPGLCIIDIKCSVVDMEIIFILMQIKLIFTWKVAHLASFWKFGFLELGSGLLSILLHFCFHEVLEQL